MIKQFNKGREQIFPAEEFEITVYLLYLQGGEAHFLLFSKFNIYYAVSFVSISFFWSVIIIFWLDIQAKVDIFNYVLHEHTIFNIAL